MANIASTIVRIEGIQLVLMAHNQATFSDEEWENGYLSAIREIRTTANPTNSGNLVLAEGSGPNAKQRTTGNAIFDAKQGYEFRVGVVTDSMMVRGAVTVFSWFNPLISAFAPANWYGALQHVRVPPTGHGAVKEAMKLLLTKVDNARILRDVYTRMP